MIWGKTHKERSNAFWQKYHEDWRPWFAWLPVMLDSGRTVWLQTVYRRYNTAGYDSFWQYTEDRP